MPTAKTRLSAGEVVTLTATDPEDAAESMGRIKEAREGVALKLFRYEQSREETKLLKQEYEAALSDLLRAIDAENAVLPLFEGAPKVSGAPAGRIFDEE